MMQIITFKMYFLHFVDFHRIMIVCLDFNNSILHFGSFAASETLLVLFQLVWQ